MSDRELLELAAKAAGHRVTWGETYQVGDTTVDCTDLPYVLGASSDEAPAYWNPLTDDGDALRLAVSLGIKVVPYPIFGHEKHCVIASRRWWSPPEDDDNTYIGPEVIEVYGDDPYAATRRAIVRAAAEIGRAM